MTSRLACCLAACGALLPGSAGSAELGPAEWGAGSKQECVVVASLTSSAAREFHAVFSRHWCLQGWASTSRMTMRESRAERWMTQVDIERNDELVARVPMSPYVSQHLEAVAGATVARISAQLMRAEMDESSAKGAQLPGAGQPGGERK